MTDGGAQKVSLRTPHAPVEEHGARVQKGQTRNQGQVCPTTLPDVHTVPGGLDPALAAGLEGFSSLEMLKFIPIHRKDARGEAESPVQRAKDPDPDDPDRSQNP